MPSSAAQQITNTRKDSTNNRHLDVLPVRPGSQRHYTRAKALKHGDSFLAAAPMMLKMIMKMLPQDQHDKCHQLPHTGRSLGACIVHLHLPALSASYLTTSSVVMHRNKQLAGSCCARCSKVPKQLHRHNPRSQQPARQQ